MKTILFLFLAFITICCKQNDSKKDSNSLKSEIVIESKPVSEEITTNLDTVKVVQIGYYDTYEKLPKLTFELISEKEFLSVKSNKKKQSFKPKQNDSSFYIQTALQKYEFERYMNYGGKKGWSGYEFLGYNPTLKLFTITTNFNSENLGFGELFFLDSLTDYAYYITSFGDGSVQPPIPSINNKYLVYYDNAIYENKNCDIGVLKINDKSNPKKYLTEHASYNSTEFAIEKLVWKSGTVFYVKGYQQEYENDNWVKKYQYYKTKVE